MVDSRGKGNRGEYKVRDLLQKWWGKEFVKTPKSGGFATKQFRKDWNAGADVTTADPTFPFSVEVKWQEKWDLDMLLTAPHNKVWGWWEQTLRQARDVDKWPLLVFKRNRRPWLVMMREMPDMTNAQLNFITRAQMRVIDTDGEYAYIMLFDDLLDEEVAKWRTIETK